MADRYDVLGFREYTDRSGEKRTQRTKYGVAFRNAKGDGFSLLLDGFPAPMDGQFRLVMLTPLEREERPAHGGPPAPMGDDAFEDEVPFAPAR